MMLERPARQLRSLISSRKPEAASASRPCGRQGTPGVGGVRGGSQVMQQGARRASSASQGTEARQLLQNSPARFAQDQGTAGRAAPHPASAARPPGRPVSSASGSPPPRPCAHLQADALQCKDLAVGCHDLVDLGGAAAAHALKLSVHNVLRAEAGRGVGLGWAVWRTGDIRCIRLLHGKHRHAAGPRSLWQGHALARRLPGIIPQLQGVSLRHSAPRNLP